MATKPILKQETTETAPAPAPDAPPALSVSKQMAERFAHRKTWRHLVALAYVVSLTAYLAWRYTIINPDSLALSIAYYAAECIGFILGLSAIYSTWSYSHRETKPAPQGLSVDVFVPTYKEPLHIIRRTVMAARDIKYPHGTYLLDDGKRDEVEALAKELGVTYLRRPTNEHAKAGNLNYGLKHSKADFVMTFDADHIALPHALDVMLGFFGDENVALVQTPQDYYNTDAFQYINAKKSGGLWHDQSAFYNLAQPCADDANASSCVGTGVVYRRAALDAIGGIPVTTVTEDIHTSLKLHKAGYKTVFLNESVAYGVAASDLSEYYKTRLRWGHGNLHALKHENILFCKGLTWRQRLHYLALGLIYLEGWQQLLLLTIPVIALATGLQPFTITIFNVMVVLAFPLLSYAMLQELGCGFARYWANEIFSMARWPVYIRSALGLFGRKMAFISSSKNIQGKVDWKLMAPQLAVVAASLFAVGYAFFRLGSTGFRTGELTAFVRAIFTDTSFSSIDLHAVIAGGYTLDLTLIAGAWALYSALRGIFFVRKTLRDAENTHDYFRFRIPLPAEVTRKKTMPARVDAVAENWAALTVYDAEAGVSAGDELAFTAHLPVGPMPLKLAVEKSTQGNETARIEGRLVWNSPQERDKLANGLYSVDWHREFLHRNAYFLTPSDVLLSCLMLKSPMKAARNAWHAVLLDAPEEGVKYYGIISAPENARSKASLVTFHKYEDGTVCGGDNYLEKGPRAVKIEIQNEESLRSLVQEGLDGARPRRYAVRHVALMPHD